MHRPTALLTLAVALAFTSCASIVSDDIYPVKISSSPSGAEFKVFDEDGELRHTGTTPATVMLDTDDGYFDSVDYRIQFFRNGVPAGERILEAELDNWYLWGNILFGGLIGWLIVDPLTGAMWEYQEEFAVDLAPGAAPSNPE